jgi:predicted membrane protein
MKLLLLLVASIIALGVTIYPRVVMDAAGNAAHGAALALFWAMSAGFVSGVGFVPRHWLPRWLFSSTACGVGIVLAATMLLAPRVLVAP